MGGWFGEVYTEYMAVTRLAHVYKQTKKDEPAIGRRWRFRIKASETHQWDRVTITGITITTRAVFGVLHLLGVSSAPDTLCL